MAKTIGLGTRRVTDQIPLRRDPYTPQRNNADVFWAHLANGFHMAQDRELKGLADDLFRLIDDGDDDIWKKGRDKLFAVLGGR